MEPFKAHSIAWELISCNEGVLLTKELCFLGDLLHILMGEFSIS